MPARDYVKRIDRSIAFTSLVSAPVFGDTADVVQQQNVRAGIESFAQLIQAFTSQERVAARA